MYDPVVPAGSAGTQTPWMATQGARTRGWIPPVHGGMTASIDGIGIRGETPLMSKDELLARISVDPNVCFGKPCIRGHRIWVSLVLDLLASGWSFKEKLETTRGSKRRISLPASRTGPRCPASGMSTSDLPKRHEDQARREPRRARRRALSRRRDDVATVPQQRLSGASNLDLIDACHREGRCLVTLDLDFSNPPRLQALGVRRNRGSAASQPIARYGSVGSLQSAGDGLARRADPRSTLDRPRATDSGIQARDSRVEKAPRALAGMNTSDTLNLVQSVESGRVDKLDAEVIVDAW